jgi:hypothetical protein
MYRAAEATDNSKAMDVQVSPSTVVYVTSERQNGVSSSSGSSMIRLGGMLVSPEMPHLDCMVSSFVL